MTLKRLQWGLTFLTAAGAAAFLYAQNPVSISQVGTTPVTTTVPVSGAVTLGAALPAGTNNIGDVDVLSIAAGNNNIGDVDVASIAAGNNNIGDVDVASSALPTGASTSAKQDTIIGHVDGLETLTGAVDETAPATDTANSGLNGRLQRIAQRLTSFIALVPSALTAGGNFKVAVQEALPAGSNAIGKLAANSGVDIGDVDVTSLPAKKHLFGSAQTVISTATDIAASNFSGAPSATYDNTSDGTYPAATKALAMGEFPDWAAAPAAGTTVDLYGVILNVDGTDDETDAPSGTAAGGAHYFGSFVIAAADALQRRAIVIDVTGYTAIDFYIRNGTAQNMNNDGGTSAVVKITPLTSN